MAVLEVKAQSAPNASAPIERPFSFHDTVAIADLNAIARAHAAFAVRTRPYVGPVITLMPPNEAYVVHALVYYIDGLGSVWSMGADGKQVSVTRFAIGGPQQWVSFAVSPDGCRLAAAVLTAPAKGPSPSGDPYPTMVGPWKLETMMATKGGGAQVLHTWSSANLPNSSGGFKNLTLVGWDSGGPLAVVGAGIGTQNIWSVDNAYFDGGTVAHLQADGTAGAPVPLPSGCIPAQVSLESEITCFSAGSGNDINVSLIDATGKVLVPAFSVPAPTVVAVGAGAEVAVTGQWRIGGTSGTLPSGFDPEGWVNSTTIFGRLGSLTTSHHDAALVHLAGGKATLEDLKFVGDYVGMLSP